MKEMITNLYANENFPIYLGAIILVLLVAFFIVFFLGKKDQKKIEMTQKLEAVNADAFKNVSAAAPVEVPVAPQNTIINNQVIQEVPNEIPMPVTPEDPVASVNVEPVQTPVQPAISTPIVEVPVEPAPVVVPVASEQIAQPEPVAYQQPESPVAPVQAPSSETIIETPVVPEIPFASLSEEPIVAPLEYTPAAEIETPVTPAVDIPEKPIPKFNPDPVIEPYIPEADLSNFDNLASSISNELAELEKQQEIARPLTQAVNSETIIPEVPVTPVMTQNASPANPTKVMTGVFSSVYAPKKEEPSIEETMEIELPKLKNEPILTEEKEESLKL